MTDPTTQTTVGQVQAPPPSAVVPPTFASVRDKANSVLLEIDSSQVHTEVSQFLIAGRAQIVSALSLLEARFHQWEAKAAATIAQSTSTASPAATAAAAPAAAQ
jgi:hypothetical protein